MPITAATSGSVANADLHELRIVRDDGGGLVGEVVYKVSVGSSVHFRKASWTLSGAEMTSVVSMLPGARQAVKDAEGL